MTLIAGALNNTATAVPADGTFDVAGDPTEIALLIAASKFGLARDELEDEWPLEAEIPFDSDRRYSATYHRHDAEHVIFVKGATERVVSMCNESAARTVRPGGQESTHAQKPWRRRVSVSSRSQWEAGSGWSTRPAKSMSCGT